MGNEVVATTVAIFLGAGVAAVLFVPFVTISYRHRGRLTIGRTVVWVAALVYFCAIWTFTLVPLPDPDDVICVGANTDLGQAVRDVQGAASLTDPVILQLVLNVALFVPLGFFIRVLGARGLPTATASGAVTSLFIELTQLTGIWGVYDCAYRVFDVDDMVTNTVGAVLGSLVALIIPRRLRGMQESPDADRPRPVTRVRRVLAGLCDFGGAMLMVLLVYLAGAIWAVYVEQRDAADVDLSVIRDVASVGVFLVWGTIVLMTGRSVGDHAVAVRYTGGRAPEWFARTVRLLSGVGGYLLLSIIDDSRPATIFFLVAAGAVLVTAHGRGLPGLLTGRHLTDVREGAGPGESETQPASPIQG